MATIHRFVVVPAVPETLQGLTELAYNIWSLWNYEAASLFSRLDPDVWELTSHNPVSLLNLVSQEKLKAAASDEGFLTHLNRIMADYRRYMSQPTWFNQNYADQKGAQIAYFSAEYGLHECLPIYSGGLGMLSGDHLKSASEMGLPLVGVGLLYREGYFHQQLNADGWQQEKNPENNFFSMPIIQVRDADGNPMTIQVELPAGPVRANLWKVQVGRINLYLMDANLPENRPEDRDITARLYGGDHEMRIKQEVLLGIGGMRTLRALGITPSVCHMNEGHSAFLSLERCRVLMEEKNLGFPEAQEIVAASNVFTTHTPVPAGNDFFSRDLIERYLGAYYPKLKMNLEQFMAMGRVNPQDANEYFGMTVLALRMAWHCNGVSKLHGEVSRRMWQRIWPEVPADEIPITHITNGVHTPTWLSDGFARLYHEYLGTNGSERPWDHSVWSRVDKIPDAELWRAHERRKERLVHFVRVRLRGQMSRRGNSSLEIQRADEVLDSKALTIGFARRFATYKRATLLMRNPERLLKLLTDRNQPVQFVFAGKAHPRDDGGKHFIQNIVRFCQRDEVRLRMVFLEDYDANVARHITQGVDVWLNTPRRPMEASGTSGMKAAANGAINLSVLDGWWCEAYNGENGWAIGHGEEFSNDDYQDELESRAIFDLLEKSIIPLYYDRGLDGLPRAWLRHMKASLRTICPVYNTNRMVQQYAQQAYLPADASFHKLSANDAAAAAALAQWKSNIRSAWGNVRVRQVEQISGKALKAGDDLEVSATVDLGLIPPSDVRVEIYYGPLNAIGEIYEAQVQEMTMMATPEQGAVLYLGRIPTINCGQQGFAVRVLPQHAEVPLRLEPGLIRWG